MKQTLRNLIADGKIKQAIDQLRSLTHADADLNRDVNLLAARFAKYEQQYLGDLADPSVLGIESNKINNALLALIDKLSEDDERSEHFQSSPKVAAAPLSSSTKKNTVESSTINAGGNVTIGDTTTVTESETSLYIFVPIWALAAAFGYIQYQKLNEPLNLTVFLKDVVPNLAVPLKSARVTLTFGDKTETKVVDNEATFKGIPPNYRDKSVLVEVQADGFATVAQSFVLSEKTLTIPLSKDGSLSKVVGTIKDESRNPVAGVQVSVLDATVSSDELGHFALPIPPDKQRPTQRVQAFKKGFKSWDFETPIIPNEPVEIILKR